MVMVRSSLDRLEHRLKGLRKKDYLSRTFKGSLGNTERPSSENVKMQDVSARMASEALTQVCGIECIQDCEVMVKGLIQIICINSVWRQTFNACMMKLFLDYLPI